MEGVAPSEESPSLSRRQFLGILGAGLASVALPAFAVGGVLEGRDLTTRHITLSHRELPSAFDGYRFLQLTDLHGSRFGDGQRLLLEAIRRERFDAVLLTGDYVGVRTQEQRPKAALAPLQEVLPGLPRGVPAYYLLGNWDIPLLVDDPPGAPYGPVCEALEAAGARWIYPATEIERGGQRIFLTHWVYQAPTSKAALDEAIATFDAIDDWHTERQQKFLGETQRFLERFDERRDFNICVTHGAIDFAYGPALTKNRAEIAAARADFPRRMIDWKLGISGHTHGGQIRLPFVGPLLTPNGDGNLMGAFLPKGGDRHMYGVHAEGDGRSQWISAGLGAGGPIPALRFRFYNPPEIAIITLRKG